MKSYFKVEKIENLPGFRTRFKPIINTEKIDIYNSLNKIISEDIYADSDLPGFSRSTMDGYAIRSENSFGAGEFSPLYLKIKGNVKMGEIPDFSIHEGECAQISTGGMLPEGTDSVVMIEHTSKPAPDEVEIYSSISPGTNVIQKDDDYAINSRVLLMGTRISSKNIGLLAAVGKTKVPVYRQLKVGIISTGDEITEPDKKPEKGKIRDINRFIISSLCDENGFLHKFYGISSDKTKDLEQRIEKSCSECDVTIITGGSSVGMRDVTISAIKSQNSSEILFHGIAMSPGKPAILGKSKNIPVWGLPGNPVSCFCVFYIAVIPFMKYLAGDNSPDTGKKTRAYLTRNIYSAPGRTDFVRVKLFNKDSKIYAEPIPGESGLIRTIAESQGLLEIPENKEGGFKDEDFFIHLI